MALSVTLYGGSVPLILTTVDLNREKHVWGPLVMLFPVTLKVVIERHSVYERGSGRVRGSPHPRLSRVWPHSYERSRKIS